MFQCGGRAVAARKAHNLEVEGASPSPATNTQSESKSGGVRWPVRKPKCEPSVCSVHIPVSVGPVERATGGRARITTQLNSRSKNTPQEFGPGFRGNSGDVAALLGRFLPKLGRAAAINSPAFS